VRLVSGQTIYLSHHVDPTWSISRDLPAATTVELPAGTKADDIAEVSVHRVVVGTDTGAAVHVTGINRGFFLGQDYRPQQSFLTWSGDVTLDANNTSAVIWRR
jgi:flagellar hook protein FlgE